MIERGESSSGSRQDEKHFVANYFSFVRIISDNFPMIFSHTFLHQRAHYCKANLAIFTIGTTITPWSSLVEGDEQLDKPNSQTYME